MAAIEQDLLVRQRVDPILRRFTIADLAAMPDEVPSGTVKYELDNGRLIATSPPDVAHGSCHIRLVAALHSHCNERELGEVLMSVGVILWRKPDRCVGPDITFISRGRLPPKVSPEDYLETIPELIVEIRSKNDTIAYLDRKVSDYLKAGARVVWIVDPGTKTVVEHRPIAAPKTLDIADVLTCDDIIPGFQLSLAELFKE
jgi:Uma2 family endonuclease